MKRPYKRFSKRIPSPNAAVTHSLIREGIEAAEPFYVGRPGGTESEGMNFFLRHRLRPALIRPRAYPLRYRRIITSYSGVRHLNDSDLDFFNLEYLKASLSASLLGFGTFAAGSLGIAATRARAGQSVANAAFIEPWEVASHSFSDSWTQSLEGKRVLVVHPFLKSIQHQYNKVGMISGVKEFLPNFQLEVLRPPTSVLRSDNPADVWASQFETLASEVKNRTFDVALIGAGSYGLPLAFDIFRSGRDAIHVGGSLQLFFGISGSRWIDGKPVSRFIDETWIKPFPEDLFDGVRSIEGGSYH